MRQLNRMFIIFLAPMIFTMAGALLSHHYSNGYIKTAFVMSGGFISGYLVNKWIVEKEGAE
ncbi:hypothetical protein MOB89_08000 [Bacillus inaquosorum]|uniref:hypothetical protein n=1 Tax=Bacillus subtilis group TaxID=653685 RepID=UPI000EF211A8|nr:MULTISPECIES: hypothetical protein [Bacillus subtilis group]AYK60072.1 hypothetical protein D9C14_01200 [Bacillus subtilis subsp. subtilis]MCY7983375.1 hypothetical protein [Bacillus inaquosorum]MDI6546722.1 hypothetical protein [Bacillus subtilis]MEC1311614.1 hypothetical protein [Bacillus subtilis]